ncbi:MAG: hypothetical protein RML32_03320 [Gammaproteobacteria bacterium]|nr:hypothetical protein [Gammaproteobacteria bacterium]
MTSQRKPLTRTIRGGRPVFFRDPAIDRVLSMVITLASEHWALRERVLAMEALHVQRDTLAAGAVDAYEFTPEQERKLAAERRDFIGNLFRVLQEQVDVAASKSPKSRAIAARRPGVFGARVAALKKKAVRKSRKEQK